MSGRPIEGHWRAFREEALARKISPALLEASRAAFYSAASAVLAEVLSTDDLTALAAAMTDELVAFVRERAGGTT